MSKRDFPINSVGNRWVDIATKVEELGIVLEKPGLLGEISQFLGVFNTSRFKPSPKKPYRYLDNKQLEARIRAFFYLKEGNCLHKIHQNANANKANSEKEKT